MNKKFLLAFLTVLLTFLFITPAAMASTNSDSETFSGWVKFGDEIDSVDWSVNYSGEYTRLDTHSWRIEDHTVSGCISELPYGIEPYCNASVWYKEDGNIVDYIGADDWNESSSICQDNPYYYYKNNYYVYYTDNDPFWVDIFTLIDTVGGDNNPIGDFTVYYMD